MIKRYVLLGIVFIGLLAAFSGGGYWYGSQKAGGGKHAADGSEQKGGEVGGKKAKVKWTCSMHPQYKLDDPGLCPSCQMKLIPFTPNTLGPTELNMSEGARRLSEIRVQQVEQKYLTAEVRLVGKIAYNERKVNTLSAWIPGRIERLFVDFTGTPVKRGDHLGILYSPELLTAQQELIQARLQLSGEESEFLKESNQRTYDSARKKLLLWGLTEKQIGEIELSGEASDKMTIYSPSSGVVIRKHVSVGDYVKTGSKLFTIAQLDQLWLEMDVYESDLQYIYQAQRVSISTEAYPGEVFFGRVAFIQPLVDEKTRTIGVRVNVDNARGKLKPGMFARAKVFARIGKGGRVLNWQLAGKWISPMHPEIVKDKPGRCDICGMKLVRAESLGFAVKAEGDPPVVVPVSAVLKTGKRAIVYVELKGKKLPTYLGKEIVLGLRAGDYYIVKSGLMRDEWVVTHGNFKLDSALQLQAKKSMMNTGETLPEDTSIQRRWTRWGKLKIISNDQIRKKLAPIYEAYLKLHKALAGHDYGAAKGLLLTLEERLKAVDAGLFSGDSETLWIELRAMMSNAIRRGTAAKDLMGVRGSFENISYSVIGMNRYFGHQKNETFYQMRCPMAFNNRGASWLQREEGISNPFMSKAMEMSGCGNVEGRFDGVGSKGLNHEMRPSEKKMEEKNREIKHQETGHVGHEYKGVSR